MTPAARIAAAINILDRILAGSAAEQSLTGWARGARYAGSKDRSAVRDHVFEALRRLRSDAALGGASSGRGLMLGALRRTGEDPETLFTGVSYAPARLSQPERQAGHAPEKDSERLDIPAWLWPQFAVDQGAAAEVAARALQSRAPVFLRVNTAKADRAQAMVLLARDGVIAEPHAGADTALLVQSGARRVRSCTAYRDGVVELQDAASQAVVQALPLQDGMRVLDYCAGGGGKALAMAARARIDLFAHDTAPARMCDLPERAARAGVQVTQIGTDALGDAGPFDLVLCDVPCSGSGAWRRNPQGKWSLTQGGLAALVQSQGEILSQARHLTARSGVLAYATCSLLAVENGEQATKFLNDYPAWRVCLQQIWPVEAGTDGFFTAHLTREL